MRDDIDLKYFEKRLKERLEAIIAAQESRKEEEEPVELDQARVGRLSRMDAMQQQAISQAAARLVDLERQRIQSALGRLQSGDYGYCALCDEEIAEGRLRFDPSILTCIACAKETDRKNVKPLKKKSKRTEGEPGRPIWCQFNFTSPRPTFFSNWEKIGSPKQPFTLSKHNFLPTIVP